jgi:hypothetical protein
MIKEVAENVDLMVEYGSSRLINQLIPPHAVKSAKQLQKLFDSGYNQIPKSCLRLKNGVPTIHTDCDDWLAKNNCLSLGKEMFEHNPDFEYYSIDLYNSAIITGGLDVAKWLHDEKGMQCPNHDQVIRATQKGYLDTIKWIVAELKCPINWKTVIERFYNYWRSHKVIDYIESKVNVTLEPKVALYRLAAKGDLTGLQTELSESTGDFPWQEVANGAARGDHADIVQWVYEKSPEILPSCYAVEDACQMGNFSSLKKVYEIDSTRVVSGDECGKVNVLKCFLCTAMHNKSEEMEWILNNPIKDKLPSANAMYSSDIYVPEEAYLRAFKTIAQTKGRAVGNQEVMLDAARRGQVRVFQWLYEQRLAITAEAAMCAADWKKVEILKAIHAINPSLVCTVEIANKAVGGWDSTWKFNVLDWMHKTCKILPTNLDDKDVKEWVEERQQK